MGKRNIATNKNSFDYYGAAAGAAAAVFLLMLCSVIVALSIYATVSDKRGFTGIVTAVSFSQTRTIEEYTAVEFFGEENNLPELAYNIQPVYGTGLIQNCSSFLLDDCGTGFENSLTYTLNVWVEVDRVTLSRTTDQTQLRELEVVFPRINLVREWHTEDCMLEPNSSVEWQAGDALLGCQREGTPESRYSITYVTDEQEFNTVGIQRLVYVCEMDFVSWQKFRVGSRIDGQIWSVNLVVDCSSINIIEDFSNQE